MSNNDFVDFFEGINFLRFFSPKGYPLDKKPELWRQFQAKFEKIV
jgi:hypothetical protein